MTVIAALVQDGRVHMAADTAGSIDGRVFHHPDKLFVRDVAAGGRAVLGFAGHGVLGALVRAKLDVGGPRDDETLTDWATRLAIRVTKIVVTAEPAPRDDDGWVDGYGLLGYRGNLWLLAQQDAVHVMDPFCAIGSGGDIALGTLASLPGDLMPARDQLEAAVENACRFDNNCAVGPAGFRYEVV